MRILILGAGKMGSFFTDILSFQHETAVFDVNPHQLRFVYNTYRFTTLEEIKEFEPKAAVNQNAGKPVKPAPPPGSYAVLPHLL